MKSILKVIGIGRIVIIKFFGGEVNRKKKKVFLIRQELKKYDVVLIGKKKKKDSMCKSLKVESFVINLEWENKGYIQE